MAIRKKNMIMRALSFWKTKLDESKEETVESEEDQKKEAAKKQADEEQAEIDAADDADDDADDADDDADDADDIADDNDSDDDVGDDDFSDGADDDSGDNSDGDTDNSDDGSGFDPDMDFNQAMDTGDSDEGDSDEGDSDEGDSEGDATSDTDNGDGDDDGDDEVGDEDESAFKLEITAPSKKLLDAIPDLCKKFGSKISVTLAGLDPEGDDEEGSYVTAIECQDEETLNAVKEEDAVKEAVGGMDGELNESLQYEPNTVGAVIKLLSKSDPRDFLFIRLAPNMKQCLIYDIDRKVMAAGQSTTYLEIAIGNPNK